MRENDSLQAIAELILSKQRILLLTHISPDGDALGSLIGMLLSLRSLPDKTVDALCFDGVPEGYKFLPGVDQVTTELASRDLVITVDSRETAIEKVSYSLKEDKLELYITPSQGKLTADAIGHYLGKPKYDLIIALDCAEESRLGAFYQEEAAFFQDTPLIVIDHHQDNSRFGTLHLIESKTCATAEIIYNLLVHMGITITPDIATNLLAGMITDTGNFQYASTTPISFQVASKLMDCGARHQDIIEHIFRMERYSTLKIWGNILTRIQATDDQRLVWSTVTRQDVEDSGATYEEAEGVIDELMTTTPNARAVILFYEYDDHIRVSVRSTNGFKANAFAEVFGGGGHEKSAGFRLYGAELPEAERKVIDALKEFEKQQEEEKKLAMPTYTPEDIIQTIAGMMN